MPARQIGRANRPIDSPGTDSRKIAGPEPPGAMLHGQGIGSPPTERAGGPRGTEHRDPTEMRRATTAFGTPIGGRLGPVPRRGPERQVVRCHAAAASRVVRRTGIRHAA
jgi:hypothetical protein